VLIYWKSLTYTERLQPKLFSLNVPLRKSKHFRLQAQWRHRGLYDNIKLIVQKKINLTSQRYVEKTSNTVYIISNAKIVNVAVSHYIANGKLEYPGKCGVIYYIANGKSEYEGKCGCSHHNANGKPEYQGKCGCFNYIANVEPECQGKCGCYRYITNGKTD
jgi:hypothetical protein